jgi:D-alanyl-D-alanine-carboxypeptidase/D-alanyl-D-alanine-endopeptidase
MTDDSHLAGVLDPLLSAAPDATGVAVAARHGQDRLVLVSGTTHRGGPPVTADTRFEMGSLTKTFTALLLADMATRGEVSYDDPVDRYLPAGTAPYLGQITLAHLATHSSGLPGLPPGLLRSALRSWHSNPYRAFGPNDLTAALHRARPRTPPGNGVHYSNFGIALLGLLLTNAADRPFEELLTDRVLHPLGLTDTGCAAVPQVTGYLHGRPRPAWEIPGLPAAGAVRSTVRDMLRYLDALVDPSTAPLSTALTEVARLRVHVPGGDDKLCQVWNLRHRPGHDLLFHSGGTRGCSTFAGFSPQTGTTLVTLANAGPTLRSRFIQRSYEAFRTMANDVATLTQSQTHDRSAP